MKRISILLAAIVLIVIGCRFLLFGELKENSDITRNISSEQEEHENKISNTKETGETSTKLRAYLGTVNESLSPFLYSGVKDRELLNLLYSPLLTKDRNGTVVPEAVSNPETVWEENTYSTPGIADISVDRKKKVTVYTITLRDGICYDDGKTLSARDLLFNYYLRFDISYYGSDETGSVPVEGLTWYQYGTKSVKKRKKEIKEFLKKPNQALKKQIRNQLIYPVLCQEFAWVTSLYQDKSFEHFTRKYKAPLQLFAHFYSQKLDYSVKGKSEQTVLKEIAGQYGWDHVKLAKVTGEDYQKDLERLALQQLCQGKQMKGENSVNQIQGISEINDQSISITVEGFREEDLNRLCDIYIVPLATFGDEESYQPSFGNYGFRRGDVSDILQQDWRGNKGSGSYWFKEKTGNQYCLVSNPEYWNGCPKLGQLLIDTGEKKLEELLNDLLQGELDIACILALSTSEEALLRQRLQKSPENYLLARRAGIVFHTERINGASMASNLTSSYSFWREIESLECL